MKVYIKNIGGLVGEHVFELREGVNEVVAPNAMGKTTLVKALLALLNPSDPNVRPEDLLNLDADEGYIKLVINGEEYYRIFRREDGRVVEVASKPLANDERFSWLLLDPFMGKLVAKILAGDENISDFMDLTFELSKLRRSIEELGRKEDELRAKREELLEKNKDLNRLMKEREEVERKLREKEKEAEKLELEKIRVKEDIESTITELRRHIGTLSGKLESYRKEREEIIERIKDIETKIKNFEEQIDEFYRKYPNPKAELESIDMEIDNIRKTMREHEERLTGINRVNPALDMALSHKLPYCPMCGRPVEEPEKFWESRAGELGEAARELMKSIEELRRKEAELLNMKGVIEREWARIRNIEGVELPSLRTRLELEKSRQKNLEEGIRDIEAQIRVLEERIRELEARMPEEERRRVSELAKVAGEVKALKEYLEGINRRIEDLGDVGRELEAIEKQLAETIKKREGAERELYELRRAVAMEFRRIANELIRELGFTWFKAIILDESNGNYFVRVIRVLSSGRESKQSLRQLSTSERISVAVTAILTGLKLGIARGYSPNKLIVLADEALLAFDPERYEKIERELNKYGRYTIVTRLAEPARTPTLTVVHREAV